MVTVRNGEYEDPRLVEVYDAENLPGWDDDFFKSALAERHAPRVLDFGCGTGRLAIAVAEDGHEVTGVDPAAASLDAARRKPGADRVRWIRGSYEVLPERAYDAVLMTSHVAQFFVGDAEWSELLHALRRSLDRRGRLIFDSRDPDDRGWVRWNPVDSRRRVILPSGAAIETWHRVLSEKDGVVELVNHYQLPSGEVLTSESTLRFRNEHELRTSLERAGFDVAQVYGGWAREEPGLSEDGELIVIAMARPEPRGR